MWPLLIAGGFLYWFVTRTRDEIEMREEVYKIETRLAQDEMYTTKPNEGREIIFDDHILDPVFTPGRRLAKIAADEESMEQIMLMPNFTENNILLQNRAIRDNSLDPIFVQPEYRGYTRPEDNKVTSLLKNERFRHTQNLLHKPVKESEDGTYVKEPGWHE